MNRTGLVGGQFLEREHRLAPHPGGGPRTRRELEANVSTWH
jgi:hypothetical protein